MYVFTGNFCDHLRLYDHEGRYVRTVYPFPEDKVDAVKGVQLMPQSGKDIPLTGRT